MSNETPTKRPKTAGRQMAAPYVPPRLANVDFVGNRETQRVMALPDQALPLVVYEAHLSELHDRMMEVMSVAGVVN